MYWTVLILRSLRSGERRGLWPSGAGGVYVKVSSLSFLQPLGAEFANDDNDGIFMCAFSVFRFSFVCCSRVDGQVGQCRNLYCSQGGKIKRCL